MGKKGKRRGGRGGRGGGRGGGQAGGDGEGASTNANASPPAVDKEESVDVQVEVDDVKVEVEDAKPQAAKAASLPEPANTANVGAMTVDRKTMQARDLLYLEEDVRRWLKAVLGPDTPVPIPVEVGADLCDFLSNGAVLASAVKTVIDSDDCTSAVALKKTAEQSNTGGAKIELANAILSDFRELNVVSDLCFEPLDLVEVKNPAKVLHSIEAFSKMANKAGKACPIINPNRLKRVLDLDFNEEAIMRAVRAIESQADGDVEEVKVKVKEEEAAEKKRLEKKAAEKKRLEEEAAEKKRLEEEAAEKKRLEKEAAEKKRLEKEAAEKKRLDEEAAEKKRLEKEAAEKKRLEKEAAEKKRLEKEAAEKKRKEVEAKSREAMKAQEELERALRSAREEQKETVDLVSAKTATTTDVAPSSASAAGNEATPLLRHTQIDEKESTGCCLVL